MTTSVSLKETLRKLKGIVEWFDQQEEVDVETGLEKVKEGTALIKESRKRLRELENEFEKVKKEIDVEDTDMVANDRKAENVELKDIPF